MIRHTQEANTAEQAYQPARDAGFPVASKNNKIDPKGYQPDCQAPQTKEDADLCAQWAMVGATDRANKLTASQLWLTFFEIIALVITISFTAWAAFAAAKAARSAEQTVHLFHRAEAGFLIPNVRFVVAEGHQAVQVHFVNKGRSAVAIQNADWVVSAEPPPKPVPMAMTTMSLEFVATSLSEGKSLELGIRSVEQMPKTFYVYGGALFIDRFDRHDYMPISLILNRRTEAIKLNPDMDFSHWTDFVDKLNRRASA